MTNVKRILGLGIGGYRSFAADPVNYFAPLSKINLIAGQNNVGKSNVLRFIHALLASDAGLHDTEVKGDWDKPLLATDTTARFAWGFDRAAYIADVDARFFESGFQELIEDLLQGESFTRNGSELIWWEFVASNIGPADTFRLDGGFIERIVDAATPRMHALAGQFSSQFTRLQGGGQGEDMRRVISVLAPSLGVLPPARTIIAFRQISSHDEAASGLSGANLIQQLRTLQNPTMADRADQAKFQSIVEFVRAVLDDDSVEIEIPHDLSAILITQNGHTLPLEYLGTGIHEVVILAAAATIVTGSVVCIEEPEIHLHPVLQRKLLAYLARETDNQYFIATHSAHMLDAELGSIFHLQSSEGGTVANFAGGPAERAAICADLGYRPSDLVQANSIIWVEGPSDRIYVRHWIEMLDPSLIEGTHYSIMFYGGRLLNHLSANDPEVTDFISLRRLNRNMAIHIDSDKTSPHMRINSTKQRIVQEFADGVEGFAWVTKGYTIENYVPDYLLRDALASQSAKPLPRAVAGLYENPLDEKRLHRRVDKVKLAHEITAAWPPGEWNLDLRVKMNSIVQMIQQANR